MPFSIAKELEANKDHICLDVTNKNLTVLRTFLEENYDNEQTKVTLRDDSRLAYLWATGQIVAEVDEISEELAFIQTLSEKTSYQRVNERVLREISNALKSKHRRLSWNTVWSIVRKYGPDLVKYSVVLDEWPDGVPELNNKKTAAKDTFSVS